MVTRARGAGQDDPVVAQLISFANDAAGTQAFAQALDYMNNLGGNADEIFSQLLSALLRVAEGIVEAILSGAQAVVDALLGAAARIIAYVRQRFTEAWDIPLVSDLYRRITDGSELTTLDLIALMAAVPATIVYKGVNGSAPFPDEASVTAFKGSFNAQAMLRAAGFAAKEPREDDAAASGGIVLPATMQQLLNVAAGISTAFYGGFSAVANAWPPPESPEFLSKANLALESAALVFTFPWFFSTAAPSCTDADGKSATLWLYGMTGVLLDGVYVSGEGRIPENYNDTGIIVSFLWAVGHVVTTIIASIGQTGVTVAGNVLTVVPELSVLLRHTRVIAATEGWSLPVLGAIDGLFYPTVGVLTAVTPVSG
jgi:hypothetical protein